MMRTTFPGGRPAVLRALLLAVGLGSALAVQAAPVPDLLDLPAAASARATRSLQLAVTRAGDRLVAVGERGIVLLSDDDGRNWRQAKRVPVNVALTDVTFPSAQLGWAVGHSGVVLHSSDGGETWARQLDGRLAAELILDDARRHAEGEQGARMVRTADSLVADGPDKPLLGVHFIDAQRGWVVGAYGLALATRDGGKSWSSLMRNIPNPRGKHLYQVRGDADELLVAGEQGALFRSDNGGADFREVRTPYAGTYFGVLQTRARTVVAFGLRGNAWRSADAGTSWTRVDAGQDVSITAGRTLKDGSLVLGDESGRLLRSTDDGATLAPMPVPPVAGLTGLVQAADGALILSGPRGLTRIEPANLASEARK